MKNTILIVDDVEVNRRLLHKLFEEQYEILEAEDGAEAIQLLESRQQEISIVLLDVVMPVIDGFGVLDFMSEHGILDSIPVVMITGDSSKEMKYRGFDTGVSDIITKPFDSHLVRRRVKNLIDLYFHKNKLEQLLDEKSVEIREQNKSLQDMNVRIIDTLGTLVEFRNLESETHISCVREFTRIITCCLAKFYPEYEIDEEDIEVISNASALHDVGKIAVPDHILLKPAKLTKDEFEIMKCHTTSGSDIIERLFILKESSKYIKYCKEIALCHHEKYDGKGYPDGLRGEDIPISAQIVSLADIYDALVSERVYKQAYSKEEAYTMILEGECGTINPKIIECFKMVHADLEAKATELKCK